MAGGRRSPLARLTLVAFVGLLDEPSAGQYPSQVNTRVNFFEKNIQINCRSRCHAVTPTMTSLLTLTQQPIVIHLKMEERALRPWRKSARNFSNIPPNEVEKLWLVKEIILFGETAANLAKAYGLSRKSLVRWVGAYKERGIMHQSGGKPPILTDAMKENIISEMTGNEFEKTVTEFQEIVQTAHVKDVMSYSPTPDFQIGKISRRSISRIQSNMGIRNGNAEQTTDARSKACADKINAISTAVAHFLMVPLTRPELMFNADGTSFQTGGGAK